MAIFPGGVATDADLVVAVNNKVTNLTAAINDSTLTIPVSSTSGFPSAGYITIDTEVIHYTSIGATQFNADLRGADGTSTAAHSDTTQVSQNNNAAFHNLLKDEIKAIEGHINTVFGLSTAYIRLPSGNASAPAYAFTAQSGSGMFYSAAGATSLVFSHIGVQRLSFDTTNGWAFTNCRGLEAPNGTAAAPAYSFVSDPNTGIFGLADDSIRFSMAGVQRFIFDVTSIYAPDGAVGLPAFTFTGDSDCGMYRLSSDFIGLVTGGALGLSISSSQTNLYAGGSGSLMAYTDSTGLKLNVTGNGANPAIAFSADPDLGFYRQTTNKLVLSMGGDSSATVAWGPGQINWNIGASGASTMQLSTSELLLFPHDTINIGRGGATPFAPSKIFVEAGSVSAPSIVFAGNNDDNTGFYQEGASEIQVSVDGNEKDEWSTNSKHLVKRAELVQTAGATTTSQTYQNYGTTLSYAPLRTDTELRLTISGFGFAAQSSGSGSALEVRVLRDGSVDETGMLYWVYTNSGSGHAQGNSGAFQINISHPGDTSNHTYQIQYKQRSGAWAGTVGLNSDGTDTSKFTMRIEEYLG